MKLHQVLGSYVVLACVLYTYASPIILADDDRYDVDMPGYESTSVLSGVNRLADEYDAPQHDQYSSLYRRARSSRKTRPKKQSSAPAPAPVSPKIPPAPGPASGPPAQRKPSVPAPVPIPAPPVKGPSSPGTASGGTPATPHRKPSSPGSAPAPFPLPPSNRPSPPGRGPTVPNPAPKPPHGGSQKPFGPAQPSRNPTKTEPQEEHAFCANKKRGFLSKRAFDTECCEFTVPNDSNYLPDLTGLIPIAYAWLALGNVIRLLQKIDDGDQGSGGITYRVRGGWPDGDENVPAFVKTGKFPNDEFSKEIIALRQVDQYLADGNYEGRNFLVIRGVPGVKIFHTDYYHWLQANYLRVGDIDGCKGQVKHSIIPLVVLNVRFHVEHHGILHNDLHPGNVLFDESQRPMTAHLIDWGEIKQYSTWNADLEQYATARAIYGFLESGATNICQTL